MNSKYLTSFEISKIWNIADRSVRDYCAKGRVPGAFLQGKTWMIPKGAQKPERQQRHSNKENSLLEILKREKESKLTGGIYHKLQIDMTYNSNHIEGSQLSYDQTRYIFETKTIGITDTAINVDDVIETVNHFRCIDLAIDIAKAKLSEPIIKQFHTLLKRGTSDSLKPWFKVGDYKMLANEVGGSKTTDPQDVKTEMTALLKEYNSKERVFIEDIIEFHKKFESIHPFQDGNGRVGRLVMFKECLKHDIVPILITDKNKELYYRGLREWNNEKGYLVDTCLFGQDITKKFLDYFGIKYTK